MIVKMTKKTIISNLILALTFSAAALTATAASASLATTPALDATARAHASRTLVADDKGDATKKDAKKEKSAKKGGDKDKSPAPAPSGGW
jgi:hypothetical protein